MVYNIFMDNNQNENIHLYYIILGVLMVLIAVLGIVDVYLILKPRDDSGDSIDNGVIVLDDDTNIQDKKDYMSLTKEEALVAFKEMQKLDYIPSGYIDRIVIPPNECKPMNGLLYSYESKDDIKEIFESDSLNSMKTFQKAEFVQDYYAVVFSATFSYGAIRAENGVASGCMRMFSFNKNYYDYSDKNFLKGTFVDTSPDFIKVALPVLATSSGEVARLNMIYSYDFEEEENSITLNIHSIGLGYDTDYSDLSVYEQQKNSGTLSQALQFSTQKYRYDASTKQADWVRDCDGCVLGIKVDRSIPLSDSEVSSLLDDI